MQCDRRQMLQRITGGIGPLALATMLSHQNRSLGAPVGESQGMESAKRFAPTADRMIFLFQFGSPSQVDTFDYKPELQRRDGENVPKHYLEDSKLKNILSFGNEWMASPFGAKQYGQSGVWVSDILPHMAQHVDDMCIIRSMVSDSNNHAPASLLVNTGIVQEGKPSLGSWLTYGLGNINENLPPYVVLYDVGPYGGPANYHHGFLPAASAATLFRTRGEPIRDLRPPAQRARSQRKVLELVQKLNHQHQSQHTLHPELDARIASYELAYRMQSEALEIGDLADESAATLEAYGMDRPETSGYGRMCLMARRLVERGVRVVQLYQGVIDPKEGWDAHQDLKGNHEFNALRTDRPIGALLSDLKQRGLLETTLVVWCGEFGRTPMVDNGGGRTRKDAGRNHNNLAFSIWMAGGGVKGGQVLGATDDFGLFATEMPSTVHDLHATLLRAFGLDADELYFEHAGRQERLIGVQGGGSVIKGVFA